MSFGNFSFGQPQQQQQQQQPAAPASSGGLFGSTLTAPTSSGGLFSSTAAKPAFGGFGSTSAANPAPSTSLFGNPSSSTAQPASTSLFGQPQQTQSSQPSTSLFGSSSASQPAPSGGLFGSKPGGGGLFGSTSTPPASGGLFGSTAQQPQAQSGGLFGQQSQPQQGGGLFGSTAQPQQQQQQSNALGQSTLGVSQLGSSMMGGANGVNGGNGRPPRIEDLPIEQRIEYIKASWDTSNPNCRFQYYFYNSVPPNEAHLYGRPPNATDDAAWFKAQRENPEPASMVPALAIGFDDIRKRTEAQMKMASAHYGKLQEASTRLSTLSKSSHLSLSLRLSRAQLLQSQLSHRTLLLIRHLHLLIPTLRSSSIRGEEEALTQKLEGLVREMEGGRGKGGGNVKGRMMELWAAVGQVRGERERDLRNGGSGKGDGGGVGGAEGWAVVDEESMERLAKIISDQQTALAHLTKVLKEDLFAIEVMTTEKRA